jgi:transposase
MVSKYADHSPLHRQGIGYGRMGMPLATSTMAGWLGKTEVLIEPLVDLLHRGLLREGCLQADETTVPVLNPGSGKTATGYLWVYRSGPWSERPAVVFDFQPHCRKEAPEAFLRSFEGTLQVDGYAGYNGIFESGKVIEAGCVAHARRNFYEVHEATKSPLAKQAIIEIAKLYEIEAEAKTVKPDERRLLRQSRAGPILERFKQWLEKTLRGVPPRSSLAKAIGYALNRWVALTRYIDDGSGSLRPTRISYFFV